MSAIHKLYYDKICKDSRHKNIIKIFDHEVKERSFSKWSMAFKQLSSHDWAEIEGSLNIKEKGNFSEVMNSSNIELIELIKSFSQVHQLDI